MPEFQPLARHDADSAGDGSAPPVVAPYKATRLAVRVAIPQLALLLCLSLLGHVCYEASIPEVEHKSKIHLTVGPGCIAGPKPEKLKFNSVDNVTCARRASSPHGPVITPCARPSHPSPAFLCLTPRGAGGAAAVHTPQPRASPRPNRRCPSVQTHPSTCRLRLHERSDQTSQCTVWRSERQDTDGLLIGS